MPFVTGVITKFIGTQMGVGVNMWTAYRNLKMVGLAAPYTAFADSWANLYKMRSFSHSLKTKWFTGLIPRDLMYDRMLKQPYKYKYSYTLTLQDKETMEFSKKKYSMYSNQHLTREEAMERVRGKQMVSKKDYGGALKITMWGELDLVEHHTAMEW